MLAATDTKALWYLTRGTGLVALVLLTASVLLGVVEVGGWARPWWPRFLTAGLHRNLSLLATALVVVHVATTVLDGYAPIGWLDAVVPFRSPYRSLWLGLGAVAFDLLLALVLTSLVRRRLGYRAWRAVHWAAYACWPIALAHGLGTGTDGSTGWVLALSMGCLALVTAAAAWRLGRSRALPAASGLPAAPGLPAGPGVPVGPGLPSVALGPTRGATTPRTTTPRTTTPGG